MSVFDSYENKLWTTYQATLRFDDKLMGGIPKNPKIVTGWIRTKMGITDDEEIRQMTLRTLLDLGADVRPDMTYDELEEASEKIAAVKNTNGFYQDASGLYIPERYIKAMLKEVTNIVYAGDRWGATRKGPRSFLAERAFVEPDHISLGRSEPDGVELFIGHTSGPKGPQSNLTYYEYVQNAEVSFSIKFWKEHDLDADKWATLWVAAQKNGLGALRSQGFGRFQVMRWERVA